MAWIYTICRYLVAFVICFYGFAKLNGSQFTILDSELDKPLGQVKGFWLTWYYFGYSAVYGNIIAVLQIICGLLLTFRRTTLLSAILLFGIMVNIVLVDIFYNVPVDGLYAAIFITACLAFILFYHRAQLIEVFINLQVQAHSTNNRKHVLKYLLRVFILLIPALFTYWLAHYGNRLPTELDGVWKVEESQRSGWPSKIYFERNRAYLCVFKYDNGKFEDHHFEVDPQRKHIVIYNRWLSKGEKKLEGTYTLQNNTMIINGKNANRNITISLRKI
jgi:hypothetical protein